jgi:hypothetical protein
MPQRCAKWENNQIYSNNFNPYTDDRDVYCQKVPYAKRDLSRPCPTFQVPVGTGGFIAGGNRDIVRNNWVWNNWRDGFRLLHVPAAFRNQPEKGIDTSFDNHFTGNHMGVTPGGRRAPNGQDFWWDEQGKGNCWGGNVAAPGRKITSDPPSSAGGGSLPKPPVSIGGVVPIAVLTLPSCPDPSPVSRPGKSSKLAGEAACVTWDPDTNPNPPMCTWFTTPARPKP